MRVMGIDIGTTSICAVVVESETGAVLNSASVRNEALLSTDHAWEHLQDPDLILTQARHLLDKCIEEYAPIAGIGLTGQMHGIVYLDRNGQAVSPLYTWQDGRGDIICRGAKSYAQALSDLSGYRLASGYGSVTHYYNVINGLVPEDAVVFCPIHDYIALAMAGRKTPLIHASDAAGLGLFDLCKGEFDAAAIRAAGLSPEMFPQVAKRNLVLGHTAVGIPVTIAVGDNQASFAGSVATDRADVLVNIGTGGQISVFSAEPSSTGTALETRPFDDGTYLLVGSSLCGGRALALLEEFFRKIVQAAGYECASAYPLINCLAEKFADLDNELKINTAFCGTREDPSLRGSITNLGTDNFTPEHFVVATLWGIVDELYEKYVSEPSTRNLRAVAASGNGVRKNPVLRRMLEIKFGTTVEIPLHREEAAYGAALFAMAAIGIYPDLDAARRIIKYS